MIIHSILVQMPTKTEWFKKREGRRRAIEKEKEKEVESLTHHMLSTFLSIKEEKSDWKHHGKWIDQDVYKCKKFRYKC